MSTLGDEIVEHGPVRSLTELLPIGAADLNALRDELIELRAARDAGPCSVSAPVVTGGVTIWCSLPHGHTGDHTNGAARWRERQPFHAGPPDSTAGQSAAKAVTDALSATLPAQDPPAGGSEANEARGGAEGVVHRVYADGVVTAVVTACCSLPIWELPPTDQVTTLPDAANCAGTA